MMLQDCEVGIFNYSTQVTPPGEAGVAEAHIHPFKRGQVGFGAAIVSVLRVIAY